MSVKNGYEETLLNTCYEGYTDVVSILLKHGPQNNHKCIYEALCIACEKGFFDIVKLFIEEGIDINNIDSTGKTALMYAVLEKHNDIAKLLIDHGANVYTEDQFKRYTVMDYAILSENFNIIKLLFTMDTNLVLSVDKKHKQEVMKYYEEFLLEKCKEQI